MKTSELPEVEKIYTVAMTNGKQYQINGEQKEKLINAKTRFVKLPNGSVVNLSYIAEIALEFDITKANYISKYGALNQ